MIRKTILGIAAAAAMMGAAATSANAPINRAQVMATPDGCGPML